MRRFPEYKDDDPADRLPDYSRDRRGGGVLRALRSQLFVVGCCAGFVTHSAGRAATTALFKAPATRAKDWPAPFEVPDAGMFHAIIIPAGGQHAAGGPPPHVLARLDRAVQMYRMSPEPKPFVITTGLGTPHKPCPTDAQGFHRAEAEDNARYLQQQGVPSDRILEESVSLETVGNAYFTRVLHTEVRGLRKLAVVNNRFHMPRTRHVFTHVFRIPPHRDEPQTSYELDFVEVEDRMEPEVLRARLEKEAAATPRFAPGGAWQEQTSTLREMHEWVHYENTAYAARRLLEDRAPIDPELLKSY
jgi:hypothetical protein